MSSAVGHASFEALPKELWVEIFEAYATYDGLDISYIELDLLLLLTLISRSWKYTIETSPTLWTDIQIDTTEEDLRLRIYLGVYFSKQAPITLHFGEQLTSWATVTDLIDGDKHRIQTISFNSSYGESSRGYDHVAASVLRLLSPLPSLVRIIHSGSTDTTTKLASYIRDHPKIVDVGHFPVDLATLRHDSRSWSRFSTWESPAVLYDPSIKVDFMQEIEFWGGRMRMDTTPMEVPKNPRACPRLSSIVNINVPYFLPLLMSITSNLVHLGIRATLKDLPRALPFLAGLASLQELKIELDRYILSTEYPPSLYTPPNNSKPTRRLMELQIQHTGHFATLDSEEDINYLCKEFRKIMPTVFKLLLKVNNLGAAIFIVENGFHDVECLGVEIFDPSSRSLSSSETPTLSWDLPASVRILNLDCNPETLRALGSNHVETIDIESNTTKGDPITELLDASKWPALRHLELIDLRVIISQQSYPNLSKVVVTDICDKSSATDLCTKLAIFPNSCPAVRHMELWAFPELDILFIMLERRNLLHSQVVYPLEYLETCIPCHSLHQPIIQLLRGEFPSRPSNFELSWEGNASILYDYSLWVYLSFRYPADWYYSSVLAALTAINSWYTAANRPPVKRRPVMIQTFPILQTRMRFSPPGLNEENYGQTCQELDEFLLVRELCHIELSQKILSKIVHEDIENKDSLEVQHSLVTDNDE